MQRIPVVSQSLKSVGYDPSSKVLEVEFTSGAVYQYTDVDEKKHRELMASPSKGRYFHAHVAKSHQYKRLPDENKPIPDATADPNQMVLPPHPPKRTAQVKRNAQAKPFKG